MSKPATALVQPRNPGPASGHEFVEFLFAYFTLLPACADARERGLPPTAAPVECERLRQLGVGDDVLLWMLYQGHVHHLERGPQAGEQAEWVARPSAVLAEGSAFAVTPLGEQFGEALFVSLFSLAEDWFDQARELVQVGSLTPRYEKKDRLFAWGWHVLKCYRQPSVNQELILSAAEELGWGHWFDDPLPRSKVNPKERLHDAIKNLNRHQSAHLVRFKGDGTGTRIGWELR